ncbi:hypothetical protein B4065_2175 [Caldibacillus thermoamylovorans]|nr:hypothetical protein B4065_2175 [Caldibacillus thermoamylovorans]
MFLIYDYPTLRQMNRVSIRIFQFCNKSIQSSIRFPILFQRTGSLFWFSNFPTN